MSGLLREREYQVPPSVLLPVAIPVLLGLLVVAVGLGVTGLPVGVVVLVTALTAAPVLLLLWRAGTVATRATPAGLVVRGLFGTRRLAWREIQDIRLEANPGAAASTRAPPRVVVAYDDRRGRWVLPAVDDRGLAGQGLSLDGELAWLRQAWRLGRGPQWRPSPDLPARVASAERFASRIVVSVVAFSGGLLLGMAVAALGVLTSLGQGASGWVFRAEAVLVLPVVAVAAVLGVDVLLGRRRRH